MSLLGVVSAINSALGSQSFSLGSLTFQDTEVPSELIWGGYQAHQIFRQAGGGKNIVLNGYYDVPLGWSGIFRGASAFQRAQTLDAMARSGNAYSFTGAGITRQVVITSFEAMYTQNGTIIPYKILCEIIPQTADTVSSTKSSLISLLGSNAASALSSITGISSSLSSFASSALSLSSSYLGELTPLANVLGSGNTLSTLSATISGISTKANALSSLSTTLSLQNLGNDVTSAISSAAGLFNTSNNELGSIAAYSQSDLVASPSALQAATAYSGLASATSVSQSYLKAMASNISTTIQGS